MAILLSDMLKAVRRSLWKQGVYGERWKHERLPDGGHRITLEFTAAEVTDDERRGVVHASTGRTVGALPTEPTKPADPKKT